MVEILRLLTSQNMNKLADKYNHIDIENKVSQDWEKKEIYKWDPKRPRSETFAVDTPPPTVSGSLHVGHVFSYTQTDLIVRYQRMNGKNIFYPMGWDDNGLPTERRVQNYYGIKCESKVPYQADWKANENYDGKSPAEEVSRRNFIETCSKLTSIDEAAFENMWRRLGLSVDWSQTYSTVGEHCRKISQASFIDLVEKGYLYSAESPTMWDVDFRSAIAQAELEDREKPGAYHDIEFATEAGQKFVISTTRPELLAACIAVVAHPSDERFKNLFGSYAITPLFHARVPILAAEHADPEKGSGILMVCTFGDANDVAWWKQSKLPPKQIITRDGKLADLEYGIAPFDSVKPELANANYKKLANLYINQARKKIVELLSEDNSSVDGSSKALVAEPKTITHAVKYFEKGDRPIEFITTRQWFVKVLEHKKELLEQGEKINWYPDYMKTRYEHWVLGLNQDWCISRQRYFGVPFPVWYPVLKDGSPDYANPIFADPKQLPVDPASDTPNGYDPKTRDLPGGFTADPDVMDTWATSALTPQIASHWSIDQKRHEQLFPMDIRPQSHEIIRTWAFSTICKSWMHEQKIPWKNVLISGWILDPDRKKMSKSKGNVIVPDELITKHSADAVRYWSSKARLGVDTAYDESLFKIGGKLTTKLFNASKFVITQLQTAGIDLNKIDTNNITEALDLAFVLKLKKCVQEATQAFERFDYAQALSVSEELFWDFCDNYLELVKVRSYGSAGISRDSSFATLGICLKTFIRLFAPFLPFITEELWQSSFSKGESVHITSWPKDHEYNINAADNLLESYAMAADLLSQIRSAKTAAQKSLKWEIQTLKLSCSEKNQLLLKPIQQDLLNAGNVRNCEIISSTDEQIKIEIEFNNNWEPVSHQGN